MDFAAFAKFLEDNPLPIKHQIGKAVVGAVAGIVGTALAQKAYGKAFNLEKYKKH